MKTITRKTYAQLYGPTKGDRLRLADTELVIEIEKDHTVYGEEITFGGGKVIRDGMGQGQRNAAEVADLVITNVVILDHWGIVKADVGIKNGRISGIGKAGNPDIQPGVSIIVGPGTDVIAGEGNILTAGAIDTHIHFIAPQQAEEALASGTTTLVGGGTGPTVGTLATTVTPGPWALHRMLEAAEALPVNVGLLGKGNTSKPEPLREVSEWLEHYRARWEESFSRLDAYLVELQTQREAPEAHGTPETHDMPETRTPGARGDTDDIDG